VLYIKLYVVLEARGNHPLSNKTALIVTMNQEQSLVVDEEIIPLLC